MDEIDVLSKALNEYNHAKRLKRLNQELYDQLVGSINFIFKYTQKNDIPLPNKEVLVNMIEKSEFYMDEFTKLQTQRVLTGENTDGDLTESN